MTYMYKSTDPQRATELNTQIEACEGEISKLEEASRDSATSKERVALKRRISILKKEIGRLREQMPTEFLDEQAAIDFIFECYDAEHNRYIKKKEAWLKRAAENPKYAIESAHEVVKAQTEEEMRRSEIGAIIDDFTKNGRTLKTLVTALDRVRARRLSDVLMQAGGRQSTSALSNAVSQIAIEALSETLQDWAAGISIYGRAKMLLEELERQQAQEVNA